MNHFEKGCKSTAIAKAGKQKNNEVCQLNDELLTLNGVDNRRAYCHLNVDGQSVYFLLDCGATANVLPLDCAAAINPRLTNLRPARSKLRMFDNTELKTIGKLTANVQHPQSGKRRRMEFYVAKTHNRAILGVEACQAMDLIFVNYDNICTVREEEPSQLPPKQQSSKQLRGRCATSPSRQPQPSSQGVQSSLHRAPSIVSQPSSFTTTPLTRETILERYADLFSGIGVLEGEVHLEIDPTVPPVQLPLRRLPIPIKDRVQAELDEMCRNGILEKVTQPSAWISALLVLHKPNGRLRVCLDPKFLNIALKRNVYPMPTIDDVLPRLANAKVFSTVDVTQGFTHLRLDKPSSALITFETPWGRYRWLRLRYGLAPSPEIFQFRMHQLVEGLDNVACIADDFLIYGCGETVAEALIDHDRCLIAFLDRCREKNLHLNREKLQVNKTSTTFMGHELTKEGLRPDRRKVAAILDMPNPEDRPALSRLLGIATYLAKFVPQFSNVTAKLRELLLPDVEFRWDNLIHGAALRQLKEMLVTAHVLRYYDVTKSVVVQADRSSKGLGAAILQDNGVVEFASRKLTPAEENYAQIEKELLAVVFAMERFRTYLYGRTDVVTVETDHKPLISIVKKSLTAAPKRLQRLLLRLQAFSYRLVYRPGSQMLISDCLVHICRM